MDRGSRLRQALVHVAAVTPHLPGPPVDPDDPARLPVAVALPHELEVFRPLSGQLPPSLRLPVLPDLEVHRTPCAGVLRRPLGLKY